MSTMTTGYKLFLAVFLVALLVSGVDLYLKAVDYANIQIGQIDSSIRDKELKDLSEGWSRLNKEMDSMVAEADATVEYLRKMYPPDTPSNGVKKSYHDGGHENSLVQDIDKEKGLVLVTTIESRMSIIFKPTADDFQKFNIGWWPPVSFQCTKKKKGKCDFDSPYKLFVSNSLVEVKQIEFPKN